MAFRLNLDLLEEDTFIMSSIALSSEAYFKSKDSPSHYMDLVENSVGPRLITIAVRVRQLDDALNRKAGYAHFSTDSISTDVPVAHLEKPSRQENKGLNLRETLNKIIHALRVEFVYNETSNGKPVEWTGQVRLHGTHYGDEWTASVDVHSLSSIIDDHIQYNLRKLDWLSFYF
jgi:hypothetical protein